MNKPQRWYEVMDGALYVYDDPFPARARAVSVCRASALPYYRRTFHLVRVWGGNLAA